MPRYTSKDFDEMMGSSTFDEFKESIKNSDEDKTLYSKSSTVGIDTQKLLLGLIKINPMLTETEANEIMKIYLAVFERIYKENELI